MNLVNRVCICILILVLQISVISTTKTTTRTSSSKSLNVPQDSKKEHATIIPSNENEDSKSRNEEVENEIEHSVEAQNIKDNDRSAEITDPDDKADDNSAENTSQSSTTTKKSKKINATLSTTVTLSTNATLTINATTVDYTMNTKQILPTTPEIRNPTHPYWKMNECEGQHYTDVVEIRRMEETSSFRIRTIPVCTGVLIHYSWVLSAAHCYNPTFNYHVRVGFKAEYAKVSPIYKVFVHPDYNPSTYLHDIALYFLIDPIAQSKYVQYAKLPRNTMGDNVYKKCQQAMSKGFKRMSTADSLEYKLLCFDVKIRQPDVCGGNVTDDTLCVTSPNKTENKVCFGEYGGPLICNGLVIGIVAPSKNSTSVNSCINSPTSLVRVDANVLFIKTILSSAYIDLSRYDRRAVPEQRPRYHEERAKGSKLLSMNCLLIFGIIFCALFV